MLLSGIAWGVYSLRGKGVMDPIHASSGNFMRAMLIALLFSLLSMSHQYFDATGALYAIASGAIASGVGYVIWYTVLPFLKATHAAIVQLSVPMMAALGGVVLLNEVLSLRLVLASITILGGIALVMFDKKDSLN
jgi:drug/metabolite transporter (DMT)-like permease